MIEEAASLGKSNVQAQWVPRRPMVFIGPVSQSGLNCVGVRVWVQSEALNN